MREREQRAEARSIRRLLCPPSVAVVGASNDPGKIGHAVLGNLLRMGFDGPLYPVQPARRGTSAACAPTASVADVPAGVDLVVIAVPADAVPDVVRQCAARGVRGLVVHLRRLRRARRRRAERARGRPRSASWSPRPEPTACGWSGRTAWASSTPTPRSGSTRRWRRCRRWPGGPDSSASPARSAWRSWARPPGAGSASRRFVSAGNRADVSGNDLLQYWETDQRTDVVLHVPRELRQPAQVRPAGPPAGPRETDRRGQERRRRRGRARAGGQTSVAGARRRGRARCSRRPA